MVNKIIKDFFLFALVISIASCTHDSEEEIVPVEEKIELKTEISLTDPEYFPVDGQLTFGLFEPGDKFTFREIELSKPKEGESIRVSLQIDKKDAADYEAKLFVKESEIKRMVLKDYGLITLNSNYSLSNEEIEIVNLSNVQNFLFSSNCIICHGQAQSVAADLYLLPDSSFSQLVNIPSVNSSLKRVVPFEPENSFILKVMNKEIGFEHTASTNVTASQKELLTNWIKKGAPAK